MKLSPRRIAAALALAVAAAAAWIALVGVAVEVVALRAPLARALSDALARPVRIDGPVALRVSLWPHAAVRGLTVESPPGFALRELATLGELRLAVDLLPLLAGEVRVRELAATGLEIALRRDADGRSNWAADVPEAGSGEAPASLPRLDIQRVEVRGLRVTLPDGYALEVTEAVGEAPRGAPVRITLRGLADRREAWNATLDGEPLDRLVGNAPWRFDARAEAGGATLAASGTVTDALGDARITLGIGAGSHDLAETARRFGVALPPLGAAAATADVTADARQWTVENLNLAIGQSTAAGRIAFDASGARPRITGALNVPRLDLGPLFADAADAPGPPKTLAQTFRELERTDLDVRRFAHLDADVAIDVEDVDGLPGDLRDVSVRVVGSAERLSLPMKFMLAGARFAGEASADIAAAPARYAVTLAAGLSPFGGIAEVVFGAPYVDGTIREMRFELASEGERPRELLQNLAVRGRLAGAALTYGNFAGAEPVRMTIDRADLAQPRGGKLSARVNGTLLGRPLDGTLQADSVESVVREGRTRFAFNASSGSVRAALSGRLAEVQGDTGPDIAVKLSARRAAELAPWLGFASTSDLPVDLAGTVQVRSAGTSVLGLAATLGRSVMQGDYIAATAGGRAVHRLALASERLDVGELQELGSARDRPRGGVVDIPLLPAKLDVGDADMDVRVKRIDGTALRTTDVTFTGSLRAGVMPPSPLALAVEGVPLDGALSADFTGDVPRLQLWLQGRDVDVAKWLRALGMGANVEATAADLRLHADIRDTTVGRGLDASSVVANLGQGRLVVRDRNTKAAFRLRVEEGEVRADPGQPLQARIKGRVFRAPIELALVTGRLRQFVEARRMPLEIVMSGAAARLTLSGEVAPRVAAPEVDLVVGLTGTTFADLGPLLRKSLPAWGPYAGAARLRVSQWGYEVEDLRFAVGDSVLEGRAALDTSRARPLLTVALDAPSIQLDDFAFGAWSPFDAPQDADTRSMAARIEDTAAETGAQVQAVLDPELLAAYDAKLSVDVREVLSGRDRLGRGRAVAKVEQGGLELEPVEVEMVGGSARLAWSYRPRGEVIETRARVVADRFDYGVLARRIAPDTDLAGTFSLDLDVTGTSRRLGNAIARGNGRLDFAVWPERLHAGVFDLWATNVFLAVLPAMQADVTKVNCAIGEFDLRDGVLTSRRILIDTTNTRAQGSAVANLPGNAIEARLVPQSKVPQFFTLATPIEVTGTLSDFGVKVRPGDVFATVARWASSLVVVPIRKLTETPPPADGSDVCKAPFRAPAESGG